MNGFHCGELAVYTRVNNGNRVTRWKLDGDLENRDWQRAAVDLDMTSVTEVRISWFAECQISLGIKLENLVYLTNYFYSEDLISIFIQS